MNGKTWLGVFAVLAVVGSSQALARESPRSNKKAVKELAAETLTLKAGESKDVTVNGLTRVSVGDQEIADIKAMGGNVLRIKALARGKTQVLVWTSDDTRKSYLVVVQ